MAPALLTTTTLHHLNRAAELYSTLHPTLSAHLLSRALDLQYSEAPASTISPPPPSTVCPFCAGPKLPGTTGTLQTRKHELTWSCALCGKDSSSAVAKPKHKVKGTKKQLGVATTEGETGAQENEGRVEEERKEEAAKERAKDGGVKKKRAKTKGGKLAAMLAKQKETKPAGGAGGFGLDLADLMKLG